VHSPSSLSCKGLLQSLDRSASQLVPPAPGSPIPLLSPLRAFPRWWAPGFPHWFPHFCPHVCCSHRAPLSLSLSLSPFTACCSPNSVSLQGSSRGQKSPTPCAHRAGGGGRLSPYLAPQHVTEHVFLEANESSHCYTL